MTGPLTAYRSPLTEEHLEELLSRPTAGVVETLAVLPGDILVLGAGGKMGPSLARMARRALDQLGSSARVIAISRFGDAEVERGLQSAGVETRRADLLDHNTVAKLPEAPNLVFMAGQKFGTSDAPSHTWAMNALVPALVAQRFPAARTVVFSTGNVYPLTPAASGGPREDHPPGPIGEYAMSCLARERIFEHAALTQGTPVAIIRLNYACDLRYGVLLDLARKVHSGTPIDLGMGYLNLIWQGDANARCLQCLRLAAVPAKLLNVTGQETLSVRRLAERFGALLGKPPRFAGSEAPDALLSDASQSATRFGPPTVMVDQLIEWTADWLARGGRLLDKPTHFEERGGRF